MSIQDIRRKINLFIADDAVFLALVVSLVSVVSFGLGRSSVHEVVMADVPAAVVTATHSVLAAQNEAETVSEATEVVSEAVEKYVASKNSNKYHLPWCSGAKRISEENKIWFMDKKAAQQAGYSPAKNCKGI